jgi:subtilase family serine protease
VDNGVQANSISAAKVRTINVGDEIEIPLTVKNVGKSRAKAFKVVLSGNGVIDRVIDVNKRLRVNQAHKDTLTLVATKPGTIKAKIIVDPEYRNRENNVNNNESVITYKVEQPKGNDLAVTDFTVRRIDTKEDGVWAEISYTMINVGTKTMQKIQSSVTLNGKPLLDNYRGTIKPGQKVPVQQVVKIKDKGHMLRFRMDIDPLGTHNEFNKKNNRATFFVKRKDF